MKGKRVIYYIFSQQYVNVNLLVDIKLRDRKFDQKVFKIQNFDNRSQLAASTLAGWLTNPQNENPAFYIK